jgi:hypothetical protein
MTRPIAHKSSCKNERQKGKSTTAKTRRQKYENPLTGICPTRLLVSHLFPDRITHGQSIPPTFTNGIRQIIVAACSIVLPFLLVRNQSSAAPYHPAYGGRRQPADASLPSKSKSKKKMMGQKRLHTRFEKTPKPGRDSLLNKIFYPPPNDRYGFFMYRYASDSIS